MPTSLRSDQLQLARLQTVPLSPEIYITEPKSAVILRPSQEDGNVVLCRQGPPFTWAVQRLPQSGNHALISCGWSDQTQLSH